MAAGLVPFSDTFETAQEVSPSPPKFVALISCHPLACKAVLDGVAGSASDALVEALLQNLGRGLAQCWLNSQRTAMTPRGQGGKYWDLQIPPTSEKLHNQTLLAGALVLRLRNKSDRYTGAWELDESHTLPYLVHPQDQNVRNAAASRKN